jgi:peptidyl-tRNA hydrolase
MLQEKCRTAAINSDGSGHWLDAQLTEMDTVLIMESDVNVSASSGMTPGSTIHGAPWMVEDCEPWAMNLVARFERGETCLAEDLWVASAQACLRVLYLPDTPAAWAQAIERWEQGRIRKLCRRARGAQFEATGELAFVEAVCNNVVVRGFAPVAVDAQPKVLSRLQMSGTDLARRGGAIQDSRAAVVVHIFVNGALEMSAGKAAVQVAHGAQLLARSLEHLDPERFDDWREGGFIVEVVELAGPAFDDAARRAGVAPDHERWVEVHDAGFTEIPTGSLTVVAGLSTCWASTSAVGD